MPEFLSFREGSLGRLDYFLLLFLGSLFNLFIIFCSIRLIDDRLLYLYMPVIMFIVYILFYNLFTILLDTKRIRDIGLSINYLKFGIAIKIVTAIIVSIILFAPHEVLFNLIENALFQSVFMIFALIMNISSCIYSLTLLFSKSNKYKQKIEYA